MTFDERAQELTDQLGDFHQTCDTLDARLSEAEELESTATEKLEALRSAVSADVAAFELALERLSTERAARISALAARIDTLRETVATLRSDAQAKVDGLLARMSTLASQATTSVAEAETASDAAVGALDDLAEAATALQAQAGATATEVQQALGPQSEQVRRELSEALARHQQDVGAHHTGEVLAAVQAGSAALLGDLGVLLEGLDESMTTTEQALDAASIEAVAGLRTGVADRLDSASSDLGRVASGLEKAGELATGTAGILATTRDAVGAGTASSSVGLNAAVGVIRSLVEKMLPFV